MEIHGLNKLTLLDYPEHLGATVFTGHCNLRCPFCHNASLVLNPENDETIPEEEVLIFLTKRKAMLEGVCITGGEPTLQQDLPDFLQKIKALGYKVKLDTNGTRPDVIKRLLSEKLLDYIAMDIKNCRDKYALTCGLSSIRFQNFEQSIQLIRESGLPYEFRTTVVKEFHSKEDLLAIGEWLKGSRRYALQAFVDSGDLIQPGLHRHDIKELTAFKEMLLPFFEEVLLRGVDEAERKSL